MPGMSAHLSESQQHTREYTPPIQVHTLEITRSHHHALLRSLLHTPFGVCVGVCV